ncbi:MAG: ribonuclease H family protein [Planctomycetota bacterium]|jgi:ribonuclease HII
MAVLAGIDEAGFGPILGPLTVSSVAFSIPESLIKKDLWLLLKKSTANKRKHLAGRLLITDSKKAHTKAQPIKHLERTVLTCLKSIGHTPATITELLDLLSPDCIERLKDYPWHQNCQHHKLPFDSADMKIASAVLKEDLASNNIKLLNLKSCCLDVAHYNKMVEVVKNKATVLFAATSQLIKHIYDSCNDENLQIIIDRQGGRVHYRTNLQRMFPDMTLKILQQSPANSSYELTAGTKKVRLHFTVAADQRFLPVSLASMVSKYLRELLVANINRYFTSHCSQLKPTAGYWKDGLRFIDDLKKFTPNIRYKKQHLIRVR